MTVFRVLCLGVLLAPLLPLSTAAEEKPTRVFCDGLPHPRGAAVGLGGRIYVSVAGEIGKAKDGAIVVLQRRKAVPFAAGLDDPGAIAAYQDRLFVLDGKRVFRVDRKGKVALFVGVDAFPRMPKSLDRLAIDAESGTLYVSDRRGGTIYRISAKGKVDVLGGERRLPALGSPAGLALDGASHLLAVDARSGALYRIKLATAAVEKLAGGLGGGDSLVWDKFGRLFCADRRSGRVFVIARPGRKPVAMAAGLTDLGDLCLDPEGMALLAPDQRAGSLRAVRIRVPGAEVDASPLPIETELAFGDLQWTGWQPVNDRGQITPLRPIVLTHAGDGSKRIFVATQRGVVHHFRPDAKDRKTTIFLDIHERVTYNDKTNEEGFLGLAFHPQYKKNGTFYVFYTTRTDKLTNVLARFRVKKDDPQRADPASEEEILRIKRPFWNHDGGTIVFGPDGFLYVALGDGGSANDPFKNGQNKKTILGKILRLDVDHQDSGKRYAIPKDNPFAGQADARGEIWAYGFRNVWRMAFDRSTGVLWAADVGQNLFEEIDLVRRGGNFGWNLREGTHPFGAAGVGRRADLIEPIWEYHHDIGKSITGGLVYRGRRLPRLHGAYLYADYITGRIWALWYDRERGRVVANRPIRDRRLPILSFGEDEDGEAYLMTHTNSGKGIYRFVRGR